MNNALTNLKEDKLIKILKETKGALECNISYLKGHKSRLLYAQDKDGKRVHVSRPTIKVTKSNHKGVVKK